MKIKGKNMKLSLLFSVILILFATACTNNKQVTKPKLHNPDSKKYFINYNGCLKRKTLWRQLGI